jgi:hypothetical protein
MWRHNMRRDGMILLRAVVVPEGRALNRQLKGGACNRQILLWPQAICSRIISAVIDLARVAVAAGVYTGYHGAGSLDELGWDQCRS